MNKIAVALVLAVGGLSGCTFGYDGYDSDTASSTGFDSYPNYDYGDYSERQFRVTNAMMRGDLGSRVTSGEPDEVSAWGYTDFTQIELHQLDGQWFMNGLEINGDINALEPGQHLEFDNSVDDYGYRGTSATSQNLRVGVLGCSGPQRDDFEYDRHADRVVVDVLPGAADGELQLDYQAWFPADNGGDDHVVEGSLNVEVLH